MKLVILETFKSHNFVFFWQQNWSSLGHPFTIFQWIQKLDTLLYCTIAWGKEGQVPGPRKPLGVWHCSDVWENLMPVKMFSICYNCSSSQLMKAPHKLSLWRPLHKLTSKLSLFTAAAATVHPSDQDQLASAAARNWLSFWRDFIISACGVLS